MKIKAKKFIIKRELIIPKNITRHTLVKYQPAS